MKILLIEDDLDLSSALSAALVSLGHQISCCADGLEALITARRHAFDAILLDLSLPTLDGLELLRRLRDGGCKSPVLILTAQGSVDDRIRGLNLGADDYLAKPFDLGELQARLAALLRRTGAEGELICGNLRFDAASGVFFNHFRPLELSPREAALLKALMANRGQAIARDTLRDAVFGTDISTSQDVVEVLVHRLRKRIAETATEIVTLRGIGYLLIDAALSRKHA